MFYHDYYNVDPFKPVNVEFNMFTLEEVKKLSVARIDSLVSFTPLGEPVQGGLYDTRLGPPFMGGGKCMTCNQNNQSCLGHFGHIDLPCPVVNPLYSTVVIHILKLCCLSCYKVLLPRQNTLLLAAQLKLVDNGQLVNAYNLQNEINGLNNEDDKRHLSTDEIEGVIDLYLKRYMQDDEISYTKNADETRQTFIAETLHQVTRRRGCLHCKAPLSTVTKSFSKITISHGTKSKKEKKVKEYLFPQEIKNLLRQIWMNEKHFIVALLPVLARIDSEYPTDACFMSEILVTPSNLRPNLMVRGKIVESPRNATYKSIVREAKLIQYIHLLQDYAEGQEIPEDIIELVKDSQGQDNVEKVQIGMHNLQMCVDALLDGTAIKSLSSKESSVRIGLKQLLEKKSGIIRQNMMGKRVDYFARSVITPDPCLDIDQIGIPVEFAKKLTYPIAVTDWNIKGLHGIVLNGPNHYPGANLIESDVGTIKWLSASNKSRREALSKTLFCQGPNSRGPQIVHRHVVDGDMMLVNRQPSLHKPSIMAHRVKVLKGEKTLRLHYANCKAYNADFDGDEMNVHLPQSELAKCEAQELASVVNQYLVPRDGTPLSGLIQDHIISSVRMTIRGRFFTRREYMYFVYQALSSLDQDIKTVPPAILKPVMLWSGKQIISTLIINLTPPNRKTSINLFSKTKLEQKFWKNSNNFEYSNLLSEFNVIIRDGSLVSGVLDKNHIGASTYSLVHCFYELYGGKYSSKLLSAFSKLFTVYLQFDAFTLGVEDILVTDKANCQREVAINESKSAGILAALESLGIESLPEDVLMKKLGESYSKIAHFSSLVDRNYKKHLQPYTNKITKSCVPKGLLQPFPENNLQLMVQSGAKGSTVNTIQISCCLGQIELEGKRPPLMVSGRSLPSFPPFDTLPKAGGFIGSRFMTGIQPQEFFFHCMAGREGLIDTAVKTSRSGYLQRCLVKHLESLIVNYDMTVRDSNGSVIQYLYGEDGLEVTKSSFFNKKQFGFLADNIDSFKALKQIRNDEYYKEIDERLEEIKSAILKKNNKKKSIRESGFLNWCKESSKIKSEKNDKVKNGRYKRDIKLCKKWNEFDDDVKKNYAMSTGKMPDPVSATFHLGGHYGLISEKMDISIDDYFNANDNDQSKKLKRNAKESIRIKAMAATAAAGEPVGCIAAQSVGEPSTQMTLNTFHFAGRGEMNVTLGIPRLREILMMATKTIKTPSMEIPFIPSENIEEKAEALRKLMSKITLRDVLSKIQVQEKVKLTPIRHTCYDLILHMLPHRCYETITHVTPKTVMKFVRHQFPISLHKMFDKYLSNNFSGELISEEAKRVLKMNRENFDDDAALDDVESQDSKSKTNNNDDSDSESEVGEFDSTAMKRKAQTEEYDYEKDEDDPSSDGEIKANDSHSEFETSIKIENHFGNDKDNVLAGKKNVQELKTTKNDYSGVTIDVYKTDRENFMWAKIKVTVPLEFKRLDLTSLLKDLVERVVIHEIPGINRAILTEVNSRTVLKTEGSRGVAELFRFQDLDLNALYCNDIQMMLNTYGVEAANRVIINEVKNVFKVYGINVDTRHLSLIADYMTYDGTYKPLNRLGMNGCPSPLQQMSFESTLNYLKKATARGLKDNLISPSSSLIVGQQAKIGSGLVKLLWQ